MTGLTALSGVHQRGIDQNISSEETSFQDVVGIPGEQGVMIPQDSTLTGTINYPLQSKLT